MPSTPVDLGNAIPLSLTISDGTSGLFPQAHIWTEAGVQVGGSPFDLTEVGATGRYTSNAYTPPATGTYFGHYIVYTDAPHTVESVFHGRVQEAYSVNEDVETASHLVAAFGNTTNDLRLKAWLDRGGVTVAAPTAITLTWRDTDGTVLFTLTQANAIPGQNPDATGVYAFQRTQALQDDVTYYVDVAITDALGTVTTKRGVETLA